MVLVAARLGPGRRGKAAAHRMAGGFIGENETASHDANVNAVFTVRLQQKGG